MLGDSRLFGLQDTQGSISRSLGPERPSFSFPDVHWCIKKAIYTFYHAPFNNLVFVPRHFSGTRLQYTFHLHIYVMHTLQGDTCMLDFSHTMMFTSRDLELQMLLEANIDNMDIVLMMEIILCHK